jgi:hypothetical protein
MRIAELVVAGDTTVTEIFGTRGAIYSSLGLSQVEP